MHDNRTSRGIPVPTVWQMLVLVATACAGWLIWSELRGLQSDSNVKDHADEVATEAGLNTLRSIEALGERGRDGISELIKSLGDSDPKVRRYALLALRRLGPQASDALDPIHERLADEDPQVREFAVETYWHVRREAVAVAQAIVPSLGDDVERVRIAAAKALVGIGPPAIPVVVEMLKRGSPVARITALVVLRRIGWDRSRTEIDEAVRKVAVDAGPDVRAAALLTLARWGQPLPGEIRELLAQPAANNLTSSFGPDFEPGPQVTALNSILRLGPDAAENLPDVLALLENKPGRNGAPNRMALAALRSMKSVAVSAAPLLLELFDETKSYSRSGIAWTLIEIGADRQEVIGRLVPLLTDPDGDDCRAAAWLLACASPEEGRRQVSALIPKISPDQVAQNRSALHALSGLARVAQEAVPALTVLLEQPLDDYSFGRLVHTLGEMGPDSAPAVPVLIKLLARGPATLKLALRHAIIDSLGTLGSAARPAIPALLSELKTIKSRYNSTSGDRWEQAEQARSLPTVIRALALVRGGDPRVVAALRTQLTSADVDTHDTALDALLQLSPESPDLLVELLKRRPSGIYRRDGWIFAITRMTCDRQVAIGPLTEALRAGDSYSRGTAAWALGLLGSKARTALPDLYEALSDWQNSLYESRSATSVYHDNGIREIYGWNKNTNWQSAFEPRFEKLAQSGAQSGARSVRDVVREAILKIDPMADLQDDPISGVRADLAIP